MREHEFILNYARINPITQTDLNVLDWRYILDQAREHNIAPLLYNNIRNLSVPVPVLKEFERVYTHTAFHNMLFLEEIKRILEKINVIVLKGPKLAADVYENIGLRPFLDIDLLIKREELDTAIKILNSMGYAAKNKNFYKKHHFLIPLKKSGKIPIDIDLQWGLVDKFILNKIDMGRIWDEAKENSLPPDINILYLLMHIEKHALFNKAIYNKGNPRDWIFKNPCGNKIIWFADIFETINKYKIDLKHVLKIADEWCISNIARYNLYILNKLYPIPALEDLTQPELGLPKRAIYSTALKGADFRISDNIHIRPIRAIDLINYLFPPLNIIKKYYCKKNIIPAMMLHLFIGLKEIVKEFIGICSLKLFINKEKEYPTGN